VPLAELALGAPLRVLALGVPPGPWAPRRALPGLLVPPQAAPPAHRPG